MTGNSSDPLTPILTRTSCRAFRPDPLPEADLTRLIEALCRAPSAGNVQPWRFIVVRSDGDREALAAAAHGQSFLARAPVVIVVCGDAARSEARYGKRGRDLYVIQDTAAAVENLLIAATALGYGSCWVGAFDEKAAREALGLPGGLRPLAMVPIGRPIRGRKPTGRRPKREVVEIR